ncbi:unnamed protein product [Trichobilharzia szidati]|nr:unnamed protein product [Trichobilharzia szidati]
MTPTSQSTSDSIECSNCDDIGDEDVKLCTTEAEAAVVEVSFGVKDIRLASDPLPFTNTLAYLNVTTLEGEKMCIEVSDKGFRSVGSSYNEINTQVLDNTYSSLSSEECCTNYYETIYALLSARSRLFRDSFSNQLSMRLKELVKEQG